MSDVTYEHEGSALAVREEPRGALSVAPTVSPEEAREAMRRYQEVCEAVLTADDYQEFTERGVRKRFKKKSAVKKLQTFFSVSVKIRDVQRDDLGDGHFGFRCIATAETPNGRAVEATGGCSTTEERFELKRFDDESDARYAERLRKVNARAYHDVMSTAETRATNRAVMNCIGVGGGEVTADEVSRGRAVPPQRSPSEPAPRGLTKNEAAAAKATAGGACVECNAPAGKPHATACKVGRPPDPGRPQQAEADARRSEPQERAERADAPMLTLVAEPSPTGRGGCLKGCSAGGHAKDCANGPMTENQRGLLFALHGDLKHDDVGRHAFYEAVAGVRSSRELTRATAKLTIDALRAEKEAGL